LEEVEMEEEQQLTAELPPEKEMRQLRACMFCSLVKTASQFEHFGCTNCPFLKMRENKSKVLECTSSSFDGLISIMDPQKSWVARWQRISSPNYAKGIYAISVHGRLPSYIVHDVERDTGRKYIPRDS